VHGAETPSEEIVLRVLAPGSQVGRREKNASNKA